jgi:lactate dehydrogenase-like 2-hydroxyacid dehydrogenase
VIRIAVTELEYRKAQALFEAVRAEGLECLPAPAEEAALAEFVRGNRINHVIIGVDPYRGALYEALPKGGVVARFGVGMDGVDKGRAAARGMICANTPGALDDSVAELAVGLILAAARHIPGTAAQTRAGKWAPRIGCELRGRALAVIGCGPIGRRVARCAAAGFGMRAIGCDPGPVDAETLCREWGLERVETDFGAAVKEAAFVSLHIPSVAATRHFINAERLAVMPAGAWLINTARGAVVDECALYDALVAGRLGGAALDVFETEPYRPVAPERDLRALSNVLMTPHIGSSTVDACQRMATLALENIRRTLAPALKRRD